MEYSSQDKITICTSWFINEEVATTDTEKYAKAANNEKATPVDISEATIKKAKVKELKGYINHHKLLHIEKKV